MRELLNRGPRRFQDLLEALEGIAPNTLSDRLKRLEEAGVVERVFYEQNPPRAHYVLTEIGQAMKPIFRAMRAWGERYTSASKS